MVMSADSSDCHPTSSSNSVVVGAEAPSQSAKISVICHINQTNQNHNQNLQNQHHHPQQQQQLVEASAASSTTTACGTGAPYVISGGGRSHLENALKLPPNTSVSTYYQNTKLLQQQQNTFSSSLIKEERSYQNSNNNPMDYNNSNGNTRSTINFIGNPSTTTSTTAPVTDLDTVHTGASNCNSNPASSVAANSSVIYGSQKSNSLILSQALQQPCGINSANIYQNQQNNSSNNNNIVVSTSESINMAYDSFYHHQQQQQQPGALLYGSATHHSQQQAPPALSAPPSLPPNSAGVVAVVAAADSRPQTPDYIKSYPVMDTTVASSVKGEPELNIGKRGLHF